MPFLIEHLGNAALRVDAIDALLMFEESIAGALRDYLNDRSVSIDVRMRTLSLIIATVLLSLTGQEYIFRLYCVDTRETDDRFPERVAEQAAHFGIAFNTRPCGADDGKPCHVCGG